MGNHMEGTMRYEPGAGESITTTAARMAALAEEHGGTIEASFNDITLTATAASLADDIVAYYRTESDARHKAWLASPEGQESERRAKEHAVRAAVAASRPLDTFAIRGADAWRETVEANTDDYGSCAVRYAARWAAMMEARIAAGAAVADCAADASHEADVEGVTGFMYGCAVSILAAVWERGEELRRWHNLKTQIGDEGARANATGGVLNPALLTIGNG